MNHLPLFFIFLILLFSISIIPAYASYENSACELKEPYDPNYYGDDIVKNDPVVKLFLEKNSGVLLADAVRQTQSSDPPKYLWHIGGNPALYLRLDSCFDIWEYIYTLDEEETRGIYQNNLGVIEAITGEEIPCENPKNGHLDAYTGIEQLENDLLFRGFLAANSDHKLTDIYMSKKHFDGNYGEDSNLNLWAPYMWTINIDEVYPYPQLRIEMDKCFNVAYFGYINYKEDNQIVLQGSYDNNYHTVLTAITGKPFTPYIQVTFYEIPLREVHCNNEENKLYIKDNSKPMCLKPHTYENLLQRGYNLEKVQ